MMTMSSCESYNKFRSHIYANVEDDLRLLDIEESFPDDASRIVKFFKPYEEFLKNFGLETVSVMFNSRNPFKLNKEQKREISKDALKLHVWMSTKNSASNNLSNNQVYLRMETEKFSLLCNAALCWYDWHCFFYGITNNDNGCLDKNQLEKIKNALIGVIENGRDFYEPLDKRVKRIQRVMPWWKSQQFVRLGRLAEKIGLASTVITALAILVDLFVLNRPKTTLKFVAYGALGTASLATLLFGRYCVTTFGSQRTGYRQWRWASDMLALLNFAERRLLPSPPGQNDAPIILSSPDQHAISYAVKLWMPKMLLALAKTFMVTVKEAAAYAPPPSFIIVISNKK